MIARGIVLHGLEQAGPSGCAVVWQLCLGMNTAPFFWGDEFLSFQGRSLDNFGIASIRSVPKHKKRSEKTILWRLPACRSREAISLGCRTTSTGSKCANPAKAPTSTTPRPKMDTISITFSNNNKDHDQEVHENLMAALSKGEDFVR